MYTPGPCPQKAWFVGSSDSGGYGRRDRDEYFLASSLGNSEAGGLEVGGEDMGRT
jgi:hypothetical protein